jgi:acyl transferase domain-containing protein
MHGSSSTPIAVVGVGCVLPDAVGAAAFWQNLLDGRSALREIEDPAWMSYFSADSNAEDRFYSLVSARIRKYSFDWKAFRIPPADVEQINPMQLMILDAGAQALGAVKQLPKETTGIIVGATGLGWQRDSGLRIRLAEMCEALAACDDLSQLPARQRDAIVAATRQALDARLKPVSEDNVVNASASVAAGRINMHFDLRGPHFAVDAGFASSLAALDTGVRLLRDGTLDLALVGGASELLTPLELVAFAKLGGLARTKLAPFDAAAEGTLLGEGTALFALKRLDDAVRDGETIRAVVRGVGGSTDGRGKALVAPLADGQALAMRRAYADGDVEPSTVGFVECHATGTQVGDASEVRALATVFGAQPHAVALGSAKPFVGHLRGGAGAVGMLRAVLALEHRQIPAQINFATPNPALELDATPFYVPTRLQRLEPVGGAAVARAAVSAFGFGGNNFHAVLEAFDTRTPPPARPRSATTPPARPRSATTAPAREPIAIVGMGGSFPTGGDVASFWQSLVDGRDATREIPPERWSIDRHYDPDAARRDTSYTRIGCFLPRLPEADPRWRIPPAALRTVDPGQLLVLRAAEEALADARFDAARWDRDRVGVMLAFLPYQGKKFLADIRVNFREFARELEAALAAAGVERATARSIVADTERRFKAGLPPISEDTMIGYLGSINAARVARQFGFHGPHFVVDSACASTHAALLTAVNALRQRTCDAVLSGGVWCDMQPEFFIAACRFQALSARGSRPFSDGADGFIPGEGAGIFVLRRLEDAERDGERIHAVLRSVAGSSDGRGRSVLAPKPEGEAMAMQRAIAEAGVAPDEVDYVECHGTGTALGDVTEIDACTRAYGERRARPLLVGSVKSNIGHLNAAAGVPALVKATIAVRDGVLPPSLKSQPPSSKIDFARGPVRVVSELTRWEAPPGRPRRAGISGFGVGGSNMHMIVEQYLPRSQPSPATTRDGAAIATGRAEPPLLSIAAAQAPDLAGCVELLQVLAREAAGKRGDDYLALLAHSQDAAARSTSGQRVAVVAARPEELSRRVELLRAVVARNGAPAPLQAQGVFVGRPDAAVKVAVAFPGQGGQYANMLRDAMAMFPSIRGTLDEIDEHYRALCGRALSAAFLVDDAARWKQSDEDIHCAVFAVNVALYRLLVEYGLRADAAMGQSAGDLAALVAADVLPIADGLRAMRERTLAVLRLQTTDPGQMVALACGVERAAELIRELPGYAAIAADNAPSACIVSADGLAMTELLQRAGDAGIEATVLAVSHGYHSQLIAGACVPYRRVLSSLQFAPPRFDVVSSITGASIRGLTPAEYPAQLERQYVEPVRLRPAVETLYASGVRLFVECGPKWPLTAFIGQILGSRPHVAQATLHPKVGEVEQLQRALACLFVHGAGRLRPLAGAEPAPTRQASSSRPVMSRSRKPSRDDLLDLLRNMQALIGEFIARYEAHDGDDGPAASDDASTAAPIAAAPAARPAGTASAADDGDDTVIERDARPRAASGTFEDVRAFFVGRLVEKTGYPEDMLDLDLDLEADLGIDTVKQVAIMSETRAHFGLDVDQAFKLRDHNTIRKFVDYLVKRLGGGGPKGPGGNGDGGGRRLPQPPPKHKGRNGHARPVARLERAAAELGTVVHPDSAGQLRLTDVQCLQLLFAGAQRTVVADRLRIDELKLGVPAFLDGESLAIEVQADGHGHFQLVSPAGVHAEATLSGELSAVEPPPLRPEVQVALDRRDRPRNGKPLARALGRVDSGAALVWLWSARFDEAVGAARLPERVEGALEAAAFAVDAAHAVTAAGWHALTGAALALDGVATARFYRLPRAGEELLLHARLRAPFGGQYRADVVITDAKLAVCALVEGVAGRPGAAAGALADAAGNDSAPLDWQHLVRRLRTTLVEGEDHSW